MIIDIWGSCISRELFNRNDKIQPGGYLLQQPIHTLFSESFPLLDTEVRGTSNFTRRMALIEFNKTAIEYFNTQFKSEYIILDVYNWTARFYELISNKNVRIAKSISTEETVNYLKQAKKIEFNDKNSNYICLDEWISNIKKFVNLLLTKYKEENIIINGFSSAHIYYEEGIKKVFLNDALYTKKTEVANCFISILRNYLPKSIYFPPVDCAVGNPNHPLGVNPVHFIDEVYNVRNLELNSILQLQKVANSEICTLKSRLENLVNK